MKKLKLSTTSITVGSRFKAMASLFFLTILGMQAQTVQFVYTSDAHYGITRPRFQRAANINSTIVNQAMIAKMNNLSTLTLPQDGGVNAGKKVLGIDYVIMTGDIANRQETPIQSASASWAEFQNDYINGITLKDNKSVNAKLLLLPGNHDVSDAIGFYKTMSPLKDSTSMVNIYNLMMPSPRGDSAYHYANERIHYVKNIGGIRCLFVNMWPDSTERIWMESQLAGIDLATPVFIFTHDQPAVESKHFTNPKGSHTINATDKFENLLLEYFKDGNKTTSDPSTIEQRGFADFVKLHPNIVVYFHGNDNQNKFYAYNGPDKNIALQVINVDSPMKGNVSGVGAANGKGDETKLSFQLISIDSIAKLLTVRECLWDKDTVNLNSPIVFGASQTISYNFLADDTTLVRAASLNQGDYTIPSWTKFLRAYKVAKANNSVDAKTALSNAMNHLSSKNYPYNVNMTINGDPSSRLGFTWFTNSGIPAGSVQIVAGIVDSTGFTSPLTFAASSITINNLNYNVSLNQLSSLAGIADNTLMNYISHKVVATGLSPNTTYSYRVGQAGCFGAVGTFTTAKTTTDPFTFMYFTDTQAQCDSMFDISQRTIHAAKTELPDAKFALICGDLIETYSNPNSEWEYEQWFETMQDVWNSTPLAPIMGNHDKSVSHNFTNHFNTQNPNFDLSMSTVPGSYYSFVYGDALFMALSYEDYSKAGLLDSAANWMKAQVNANPSTKWRIAFFHKTMFTGSSSHQSDADGKIVREKMGPIFDSLKIDLALEGHDHVYELMGPINSKTKTLVPNKITNANHVAVHPANNLTGIVNGDYEAGTGTIYFLNSSAGIKKYSPRTKTQMDVAEAGIGMNNYWSLFTGRFGNTDSIHNGNDLIGGDPMFSSVKVSTDSIVIKTYSVGKHSGIISQFDAFKIQKSVVTGNNEIINLRDDIKVYPNPTQDLLSIEVSELSKVSLGDLDGKIIISDTQVYPDSILTFNVSGLTNGVYMVKVYNDKFVNLKKIVINR